MRSLRPASYAIVVALLYGLPQIPALWACDSLGTAECSGASKSVDLSAQFPPENKDQIGGTCYANAATALLEAALYRESAGCNRTDLMPEFCACQFAAVCQKNGGTDCDPAKPGNINSVKMNNYAKFLCETMNDSAMNPGKPSCLAIDTKKLRSEMEKQLRVYTSAGAAPPGATADRLKKLCTCCDEKGATSGGGACSCGLANLLKDAQENVAHTSTTGNTLPTYQPRAANCSSEALLAQDSSESLKNFIAFGQVDAAKYYTSSNDPSYPQGIAGYLSYLRDRRMVLNGQLAKDPNDAALKALLDEIKGAKDGLYDLANKGASPAAYAAAYGNLINDYYKNHLTRKGDDLQDSFNPDLRWKDNATDLASLTDAICRSHATFLSRKNDGSEQLMSVADAQKNCADASAAVANRILASLCNKKPVGVSLETEGLLFGSFADAKTPPGTGNFKPDPDMTGEHASHAMVVTGTGNYCVASCGGPNPVIKPCLVLRNSWGKDSEVAILPIDEACRILSANTTEAPGN